MISVNHRVILRIGVSIAKTLHLHSIHELLDHLQEVDFLKIVKSPQSSRALPRFIVRSSEFESSMFVPANIFSWMSFRSISGIHLRCGQKMSPRSKIVWSAA